ncbi:MAG: exonuclease SbcCD subunit D, partial [Nanoarchaeota archaeon]|nr:exonuclease SbcCD subunit D [Nanoarchaeota archaeon]
FIHCADLHLGTNRYKNEERKYDFVLSFKDLAIYAIAQKVAFILVSGDFFNKKQIDPDALEGAIEVLSLLKDAKIEVIAIEGNHDTSIYNEENSWLYFLSKKDYLKLLQTKFIKGQPIILKWDSRSKVGSYIDIGDIRIFGVGYLGASTKRKIELLKPYLKLSKFNIMMLHASINSMIYTDLGGIKEEEIDILKNEINYLALGHIHKKYEINKWIFNPGAMENWRLDEASYKKGYFHVKIEANKIKEVIFKESKRRPVLNWEIDITGCKDSNDVYKKVLSYAEKNKPDSSVKKPIIVITYVGKVDFSTIQIDNQFIKNEIERRFNPLICELRDGANILLSGGKMMVLPSKNEIEKEEIGQLIDLHPEYKKRKRVLTELILKFKTKALSSLDEEELIDLIHGYVGDGK